MYPVILKIQIIDPITQVFYTFYKWNMYLLHQQAYRGRSPGGSWSAPCGQWSCRLPVLSCWASPVASWWWWNRSSHLVPQSSVRNRTQTLVHCPTETNNNIMLICWTVTLLTKHSDIQVIKYLKNHFLAYVGSKGLNMFREYI